MTANPDILMNAEQSEIMVNWVSGCLDVISETHPNFYALLKRQYPEQQTKFFQDVTVSCVCQSIMRIGIEYLRIASEGEAEEVDVRRILHQALENELQHTFHDAMGTSTRQ